MPLVEESKLEPDHPFQKIEADRLEALKRKRQNQPPSELGFTQPMLDEEVMSSAPQSNSDPSSMDNAFAMFSDNSDGSVADVTLAHAAEGNPQCTQSPSPRHGSVVPPVGLAPPSQKVKENSTNDGGISQPAQTLVAHDVLTGPRAEPHEKVLSSITESESPAQQSVPASFSVSPPSEPQSSSSSYPQDLWNQAYDRLRADEPTLIQKYEKILSQSLQASRLSSTPSHLDVNIIRTDQEIRRSQMSQIIKAGLEETGKAAKWNTASRGAMKSIVAAKEMISSAVQASPQASIAWAGVSMSLDALLQAKPETEATLKDLEYISQRIEWYQSWSAILLKDNIDDGAFSPKLQHALEERLVNLFKALLLYQIKIICSTVQSSSLHFLRDAIKPNNRDTELKAIKDAELAIRQDVELAMLLRQKVSMEAILDRVNYDGSNPQADSNETFIVQLWGGEPNEIIIGSTARKLSEKVRWLQLQKQPDLDILQQAFPWCGEEMSSKANQSPNTQGGNSCALIVRRLKTQSAGLTAFMEPPPLFDPRVLDRVMKFLKLPDEYRITRRNDCGTCKKITVPNKNHQGKHFYYIVASTFTPFYSGGFWSLLLSHIKDPTKGGPDIAGTIQADSDVNLDHVFNKVKKTNESYQGISAKDCGYPMILPIELFSDHFITTQKRFQDIIKDIHTVESDIRKELRGDEDQHKGSVEHSTIDYGALSRTLHICSTAAVELVRRRDFERRLEVLLKKELEIGSIPANAVSIYSEMSTSRDLDIQSLPHRIESQRKVLSSLIAQRDNETQQELARAANNDSKAVKTISILTILFLPGAYVATLFTTNMFVFRDGEEIWVYWAIVVPLTFLVLTIWAIWMWLSRSSSRRPDVETGRLRLCKRGPYAGLKNKTH
ncbi:uncharacterized protein PAC_18189 [Phialocephala subalpina]|uniref:NWD NACHT-NTPase N-terminal domain-containing protein n=1 Tax=Phialocephala subalpina TaxID=576137 RepID=A0A1L7XTC4_9HELO|nr:uncharacterized protein PAC_18189 [Phialocephala subalpina]